MFVKLKGRKTSNNKIITYVDYAEIIIYNTKHKEIYKGIIDLDDVDKCSKLKWNFTPGYYIANKNKRLLLHQLILGEQYSKRLINEVCDHINSNKLDNRKVNLRIVTYSINNFNKNSKGYYYSTTANKYITSIKVNGKNIGLGRYDNENDAIDARYRGECRYFPDIKLQMKAV